MTWLLLIAAIVLETIATLSMKASRGFTKKVWIAPVAIGYVGAFSLLGAILAQGMSVGVAYGIWAASGVALTAILGRVIFRDPLTWVMAAGIALIIGGVLLVELGAQTHLPRSRRPGRRAAGRSPALAVLAVRASS